MTDFNELSRCQKLPSEDTMTENVSISRNSTETPTVFNAPRDDCVHLSDSTTRINELLPPMTKLKPL